MVRFLCDLDDTLCAYTSAMRTEHFKLASPEDIKSRLVTPDNWETVPYLERRSQLIRSKVGFWYGLKIIKPNMRLLNYALQLGLDTQILTKGPQHKPLAWKEKVEWVRSNVNIIIPINIVADKGIVIGDILFDDWPDYCEAWLKANPQGLVILADQEHNRDYEGNNVVRYTARDWCKVKALLDNISSLEKNQ